jgi:hypothetical protein
MVDLLKYFFSSEFPKCLSIRAKNFAATLVFTVSLKGGLNHMIRLDLFFLVLAGLLLEKLILCGYPATLSAS